MTWKKKWILPCLLAVFLTGCQGGKQEIPYISDGSVSWDAVEKAEIYGGGCAVPPSYSCRGDLLYLVRLSTKRMRMVATCARVALP